jgi:hypothetical protein
MGLKTMSISLHTDTSRKDVRSEHHNDAEAGDNYTVRAEYIKGGSWTIGFSTITAADKLFNHWQLRKYADIFKITLKDNHGTKIKQVVL